MAGRINQSSLKKSFVLACRIVRIERPPAEGPLAAGEKNPVNPVNLVKRKKI
jgi:hypothetical protein